MSKSRAGTLEACWARVVFKIVLMRSGSSLDMMELSVGWMIWSRIANWVWLGGLEEAMLWMSSEGWVEAAVVVELFERRWACLSGVTGVRVAARMVVGMVAGATAGSGTVMVALVGILGADLDLDLDLVFLACSGGTAGGTAGRVG
jgi:hypothetical protein